MITVAVETVITAVVIQGSLAEALQPTGECILNLKNEFDLPKITSRSTVLVEWYHSKVVILLLMTQYIEEDRTWFTYFNFKLAFFA